MRWIRKLLGAVPKEEMDGIRLDTKRPYWEVDGPRTFTELFRALEGWLPEGAVLYFEGGSPDPAISAFMSENAVQEQAHIAMGTIWPRPKVFHVPSTPIVLNKLAAMMENHAEHELAVHFHVYRGRTVLLEWHDVFLQPMLISGEIPEERIRLLANRFGTQYKSVPLGSALH